MYLALSPAERPALDAEDRAFCIQHLLRAKVRVGHNAGALDGVAAPCEREGGAGFDLLGE